MWGCASLLVRGVLTQNVYFDVAMPTSNAVSAKVGKVERKDFGCAQRVRRDDDRRIRQIHGVISVLFHQLERSCHRCVVQKPEGHATFKDEVPKPVGPDTVRCQ
jgi:hypothetical protein